MTTINSLPPLTPEQINRMNDTQAQINSEILRLLNMKTFCILLEDVERTFNINMHSFECFALNETEAIEKMKRQRPEFAKYPIQSIKSY